VELDSKSEKGDDVGKVIVVELDRTAKSLFIEAACATSQTILAASRLCRIRLVISILPLSNPVTDLRPFPKPFALALSPTQALNDIAPPSSPRAESTRPNELKPLIPAVSERRPCTYSDQFYSHIKGAASLFITVCNVRNLHRQSGYRRKWQVIGIAGPHHLRDAADAAGTTLSVLKQTVMREMCCDHDENA
jgi:hypothetical protein